MTPTHVLSVATWIALPTVMYGGYALLTIANLDERQRTNFRAGHVRFETRACSECRLAAQLSR